MKSDLCRAAGLLIAAVFCMWMASKTKIEVERGHLRKLGYILFLFVAVFVVLGVITKLVK